MEKYVISLRRELHENAECGYDLPRTLAILKRELDAMGVSYTEEYGKSSIVATVNPEKSHFTIGVRADIDALPILEKTGAPYASKNEGMMHACGHDAHAAMAMAALKEIYAMRDQISCRVKFLFQASEETGPSGAMLMTRDGVMEDIDCIIATHVATGIDVGKVALLAGPNTASSDGYVVEFFGRSAHAANQEKGVDAIMMAVKAYNAIELMVAKEVAAQEPVIFNVGSIHGGSTNNIICPHCSMYFTLRTWREETRKMLLDKIERICRFTAELAGGECRWEEKKAYPIVNNNEILHDLVYASAVKVFGEENICTKSRGMGGEDFAYFANEKPGYMFRLGVRNEEKGIVHTAHTDKFDIDESGLKYGVALFVQFILDNMDGIPALQ